MTDQKNFGTIAIAQIVLEHGRGNTLCCKAVNHFHCLRQCMEGKVCSVLDSLHHTQVRQMPYSADLALCNISLFNNQIILENKNISRCR